MKRRDILKYGAGLGLLGTTAAISIAKDMMMGHNMPMGSGNMDGMNHHNMAGMHMMGQNDNLMPLSAMQSAQALAPLPLLKNQSSTAGEFVADLVAKKTNAPLIQGFQTEVWAYNGQIPGPQIVVTEGDWVRIRFTNQLSQPTTVHWHGLPAPSDQDGNPHDPVAPGQSRLYEFRLPENSAGTYWYHPHPHGFVSEQVYMGLAGTLIVKAKKDTVAHLPEQHWMISDIRLDKQAKIPGNSMTDWMNGREGQFVLINGQLQPNIQLNGNERIRIWNATSARYLRLQIPGCEWIVIGSDGGLLEKPLPPTDELLLVPAERVEVVLRIKRPQQHYVLQSAYYDRDKMMVKEAPVTTLLGKLQIGDQTANLPQTLRSFPVLGKATAKKQVIFSEAAMDHSNMGMGMAMLQNMFLVNGKSYEMNRMDLVSKAGEIETWDLINNSHMDHPFHIHGTLFEVISRTQNNKTQKMPYRALKDTVNLRPKERVMIQIVQKDKGLRMFHCHILEHENLGMMANLKVI